MIAHPERRRVALPRQDRPPDQDDHQIAVRRARFFGLVILLLFAGLVARLWYLQIVQGAEYRKAAEANQARRIRSRAPRGAITDIHGVLLATNRSRFAVYATPDIVKSPATLDELASMLKVTPDELRQTVKDSQQNAYDPLRVALDVPIATVTRIEENRPFLPGVSTEPEPVRWYPGGKLAAHVLGTMGRIDPDEYRKLRGSGYFSDDFLGKTGIERAYERFLHGKPGGTEVQIDARGRRVATLGTADAVPGDTITLTIDSRVQAAAERTLSEHAFTGAAVAIDPRTGAVLAMASAPTYDPGSFATGISRANWAPLAANPHHPLINRAIDAMYPPGSTFKPVVAAGGLQCGAITTHTTAYCTGAYHLGKARFGCWQVHGDVDFYRAMEQSCDVFFYIAGQAIGPDRMSLYAKSFGLAAKTGIDLPGEDIGSIPSPSWKQRRFSRYGADYATWYGGDTLHMSIGQGYVLTTPLQMARVAATLANGGDVMKPFVVDHIAEPDNGRIVYRNDPTVVSHVPVSPENMERVRQAMRLTVTQGTGRVVNFPQVAVAGKTGSAQVHGQAMTHGWFICFAPYDHPTIAVAAVVERGGHGATSAGLVARSMLQAYFKLPQSAGQAVRSD